MKRTGYKLQVTGYRDYGLSLTCYLLPVTCYLILGLLVLSMASTLWAQDVAQDQLNFANGLFSRKMYEMAAGEYQKFLDLYPQDARREEALYRQGEAYFQLKDYKRAASSFQALVEGASSASRATKASLRLGQCHFFLKEYAKAIEALKKLEGRGIEDDLLASYLFYLGRAYKEQGQSQEALQAFQRLSALGKPHAYAPYAHLYSGYILRSSGRYEEAIKELEQFLQVAPQEPELLSEALFQVAESRYQLGQYPQAIEAYERVIKEYPQSPFVADATLGIGWALVKNAQLQEAISFINKALQDNLKEQAKGSLLFLKGICLQQMAHHEEAIQAFSQLLSLPVKGPWAEEAELKLCWSYYWASEEQLAFYKVDNFLKTYPKSSFSLDALFLRGLCLYQLGKYEEAEEDFKRVLSQAPSSSPWAKEASLRMGWSLMERGLLREARDQLDQFVAQFPQEDEADETLFQAAQTSYDLEDYEGAAKRFAHLVEAYPSSPLKERAHYSQGLSFYQAGKGKEMVGVFEQWLAQYPQSPLRPEVHYWLGLHHQEQGSFEKAARAFEQIVKHYPQSKMYQEAYLRLGSNLYEAKALDEAARVFYGFMKDVPQGNLPPQTLLWTADYFLEKDMPQEASEVYKRLTTLPQDGDIRERGLYRLGLSYQKLKRWDNAIAAFEELLQKSPQGPLMADANLSLASCLVEKGNYQEAMAHLQKLWEVGDEEQRARAQYQMGETYFRQKAYEEASKAFLQVAILYDHEGLTPEAFLKAGNCLELMGQKAKAREVYGELLLKYPQSPAAQEAKKRVDEDASSQKKGG